MITDSADARDVLEAVLADDWADIPPSPNAATSPEQDHRAWRAPPVEPVLAPRCSIPEWFPALLDAACHDRDRADRQLAEHRRHRDQRVADIRSARV